MCKCLLKHLDHQKRHIVQNTNEHVFAIAPQGSLQFWQTSFGGSQIIYICIFLTLRQEFLKVIGIFQMLSLTHLSNTD